MRDRTSEYIKIGSSCSNERKDMQTFFFSVGKWNISVYRTENMFTERCGWMQEIMSGASFWQQFETVHSPSRITIAIAKYYDLVHFSIHPATLPLLAGYFAFHFVNTISVQFFHVVVVRILFFIFFCFLAFPLSLMLQQIRIKLFVNVICIEHVWLRRWSQQHMRHKCGSFRYKQPLS